MKDVLVAAAEPKPVAHRLRHLTEERTAALVDEDVALRVAHAAFAATGGRPGL